MPQWTPEEFALFAGLAALAYIVLNGGQRAAYGRFKPMREMASRFFGCVWFVLLSLATFGAFFFLRKPADEGRQGWFVMGVFFAHLLSLVLNARWAENFFGEHARPRSRTADKAGQAWAFIVALLAWVLEMFAIVLIGIAYGKSGSPSDVTIAFWAYLWYPVWSLVAVVWTGCYAFGSRQLGAFLHDDDMQELADQRPLLPQSTSTAAKTPLRNRTSALDELFNA